MADEGLTVVPKKDIVENLACQPTGNQTNHLYIEEVGGIYLILCTAQCAMCSLREDIKKASKKCPKVASTPSPALILDTREVTFV